MAFPKQRELEIPLLIELDRAGAAARPSEIYPKVAAHFPQLTEADLAERLPSSPATFKFNNQVQWARQRLVELGEIDGSTYGVWKITEKGRQRLRQTENLSPSPTPAPQLITERPSATSIPETPEITLQDLVNEQEEAVKYQLLERLRTMSPEDFELFSKRLLEALNFTEVHVTARTRDGGIDGHGKLRQGIVNINAAYQSKRWQTPIPRPEIDEFRGAITGEFDQGIFITTSSFSAESKKAGFKRGAVPIILIDGQRIVELMIENSLGVSRRPLSLLGIDEEFFAPE